MRRMSTVLAALALSLIGLVAEAMERPASAEAGVPRPAAAAPGKYILATATAGGTYYPVGVAIATIVKAKGGGVQLSAVTSAGSAENVALLARGEVQFAIVQGLYADWARHGTGPFNEKVGAGFKAVTALWPNVDHWLARSSAVQANDLAALAQEPGLSLSIGKRNSGADGSGRVLLAAAGIADADTHFSLAYQGYEQAADALQNGTIDLANIPAGAPVSAVTRAMAARFGQLKLLAVPDSVIEALAETRPFFRRHIIRAGTYPGQQADIATTSQPNLLLVRGDVPEEDVYKVVKAIYENLGILKASHKATHSMNVRDAASGLPVPLHAGAARYFKEVGAPMDSAE